MSFVALEIAADKRKSAACATLSILGRGKLARESSDTPEVVTQKMSRAIRILCMSYELHRV